MPKRTIHKKGATTKRAKKVRTRAEFPLTVLAPEMRYPLRTFGDFSWDVDRIRATRDEQLRGYFWFPVKLAQAMQCDAGLFTARMNRLAPMRGLPVELRAADTTTKAQRIRDEGEALFGPQGVAIQRDSLVTLFKQLIDHGVAIGYNVITPRANGSRVDFELRAWPLEFVKWLPQTRHFWTQTRQGKLMKIEHGDGRWVVIQSEKLDPWANGALLSACMVWADRAFAIRDRSNASRSHGQSKMIGELPQGMAIQAPGPDGQMAFTPEAQMMLDLLQACHVGDLPFGLRPFGSKTDMLINSSQAWQIWQEMIKTNDADSSRIYLGQDGTTKDEGGNYVKAERLFGVRDDLVDADLGAFVEGIGTGTIDPWAAVNFGDSRAAPRRLWLFPDADEDARRESIGGHLDTFFRTIGNMKQQGFKVDQTIVNNLCRTLGVGPFTLAEVLDATASGAPSSARPPSASAPASRPDLAAAAE